MTWSIDTAPLLPLPLILAAAAVALVLMAVAFWRRQRGAPLRAAALVLLILALLDPSIQRENREPLTSVAAIVVDRSESQALSGRTEATDAALAALTERLSHLRNVETRIVEAGRDDSGTADGTELFDRLAESLADVPPERFAGTLMITDGQVHDVPKSAESFGFDGPLHVLLTGRKDEQDRRIVVERAPRYGLVGSEQTVVLRYVDEGGDQSPARMVIRRNDDEVGAVVMVPGEKTEVPVEITHGGKNIFEFEIDGHPAELTTQNNRAVVAVKGIRENLRVLLVSGEPHSGERTWRDLLKSDASVDLVHFTILRPPSKQDGTPINQLSLIAFPTRELFSEKIDEFDLIIFDRYRRRGVLPSLYFDNITQYVRNGGAILIAAGPDFADPGSLSRTTLAEVLPATPTGVVLEQPYRAHVNELGERHPVTRGLPGAASDPPDWSRWFRLIAAETATGQTVMTGADNQPLLVLSRVDKGRVALLLSDHVWLWARSFENGGPHGPLLRRLAHWLMKEPDLEEEGITLEARGRDLVVRRQTLGETVDPVTVTAPTGTTETVDLQRLDPGLWEAVVPASEIGLYSASDGTRTALASVGPANPREFSAMRSTDENLRPMAEETRGSVRRLTSDGGDIDVPNVVALKGGTAFAGSGWIGLRTTDASVLKGIDRLPLFAGLLGLALLLGILSLTWFREGR
ncbi:hypothetical protein GGD81_000231 [Rhodobium orientis]|uniref:Glutamine amidotransferase domain-containing protein n=1 Tax=Rhodobium orientis TaxID=34017 RepID=A0A327JUW9_9HYPH|nr:hypothetical protein [Rhodobium orientis]MBB4301216.1 hypothetical protein [Rhodobium orientis]MBK5951192.1 hypothetical protein [Rhodobium orientis]RAI30017.1 hypothetical protein CH339_00335 [Rhodobium orientis]